MSSFTSSDSSPSATAFDLLGFHVNAGIFGSSNVVGQPNNGIDFSNIKIETISVPEPAALTLMLMGSLLLSVRAGRRDD